MSVLTDEPWGPITTAPMFRLKPPRVDLWVERPDGSGYRVPDAFWSGDPIRMWKIQTMIGFNIRAFSDLHTATHWMPTPRPPKAPT